MDEFVMEELMRKDNEIKRLKEEGINTGFMEQRFPNVTYPFNLQFPVPTTNVYDAILSKVSGAELTILCRTRFNSPKEQIEVYVGIIQRLLDEGVFDTATYPGMVAPVPTPMPTPTPTPDPAPTPTPEPGYGTTQSTCCGECEKKQENTNIENIKDALRYLLKTCEETDTAIITAAQKKNEQ